MKNASLIIGGQTIPPERREHLCNVDPATEQTIGLVPISTLDDIERAAGSAHRGFLQWKEFKPSDRAGILMKAAAILRSKEVEIGETLCLEQGKTLAEARGEVIFSAAIFEYYAGKAEEIADENLSPEAGQVRLTVARGPVGPAAIFTPWNFPMVEPAAHCAAALATGCSVVLKVSEETPLCGVALVEALFEAGVPADAVNLLTGKPAFIAEHLIAAREIRRVALTGSIAAGRALASLAGHHLKPATMELGGNAPVIVCEDVDVEAVAALIASRKIRNAGQVCTAPNRIFVHNAVFEHFLDAYCAFMTKVEIGPGNDPAVGMGPLANERRLRAMEDFVSSVRLAGSEIRLGGNRLDRDGFFFENTVITEPATELAVSSQEIFGPISPIWRFGTDDEIVARANDSSAGLAAYVFCGDSDRANQIARQIEVGVVAVNQGVVMFPEAPFGGVRDSGYGRICGTQGMAEYVSEKLIAASP